MDKSFNSSKHTGFLCTAVFLQVPFSFGLSIILSKHSLHVVIVICIHLAGPLDMPVWTGLYIRWPIRKSVSSEWLVILTLDDHTTSTLPLIELWNYWICLILIIGANLHDLCFKWTLMHTDESCHWQDCQIYQCLLAAVATGNNASGCGQHLVCYSSVSLCQEGHAELWSSWLQLIEHRCGRPCRFPLQLPLTSKENFCAIIDQPDLWCKHIPTWKVYGNIH